jgi:hypothetical protein
MYKARQRHRKNNKRISFKVQLPKNFNIFKYLSILLIILFILSTPAFIKKLIKITKIDCHSQYGPCEQSFQVGDYLSVKKHIEEELKQNIKVNSYVVQYKIPSTVKIDLNLKKPKFSVKDKNSIYYLIDKNGLVLEISNKFDLPWLDVDNETAKTGEYISDKEKFALQLIEKVSLIEPISESKIIDESLLLNLKNGKFVKFPLEGDVDVLVGSLRLIFSRLNEGSQGIRMEDVREIDLRFKNPVLR